MSIDINAILSLPLAEKLELFQRLGDDIAESTETIPLTEWQKQELERSNAEFTANPDSAMTWDEVKRRVRGRHGR